MNQGSLGEVVISTTGAWKIQDEPGTSFSASKQGKERGHVDWKKPTQKNIYQMIHLCEAQKSASLIYNDRKSEKWVPLRGGCWLGGVI